MISTLFKYWFFTIYLFFVMPMHDFGQIDNGDLSNLLKAKRNPKVILARDVLLSDVHLYHLTKSQCFDCATKQPLLVGLSKNGCYSEHKIPESLKDFSDLFGSFENDGFSNNDVRGRISLKESIILMNVSVKHDTGNLENDTSFFLSRVKNMLVVYAGWVFNDELQDSLTGGNIYNAVAMGYFNPAFLSIIISFTLILALEYVVIYFGIGRPKKAKKMILKWTLISNIATNPLAQVVIFFAIYRGPMANIVQAALIMPIFILLEFFILMYAFQHLYNSGALNTKVPKYSTFLVSLSANLISYIPTMIGFLITLIIVSVKYEWWISYRHLFF